MAIWQYSINLIPRSWAEGAHFSTAQLIHEAEPPSKMYGYDASIPWKGVKVNPSFKELFSKILPRAESWADDILIWDSDCGHDIQVLLDGEDISYIEARVSLLNDYVWFIKEVITAALELDCVIFSHDNRAIIRPNIFELKNLIRNSRTASLLRDRSAFDEV